jgi:hypothetical protein
MLTSRVEAFVAVVAGPFHDDGVVVEVAASTDV